MMFLSFLFFCIYNVYAVNQKDYEECESFLKEYMPSRDIGNNPSFPELMNETITYALLTREQYSYAKDLPMEIFMNYVLPYYTLTEPRENWRKYFYLKFYNKSMEFSNNNNNTDDITMWVINNFVTIFGLKFVSDTNDLSYAPFEVITKQYASCTGNSNLVVAILRSIGIASRVVGTPMWNTNCTHGSAGNHNWIESYNPITQAWSFTDAWGYGNPTMNTSWFYPGDTKCALDNNPNYSIWAQSYKPTGYHYPIVWDWNATYINAYNVTDNYLS